MYPATRFWSIGLVVAALVANRLVSAPSSPRAAPTRPAVAASSSPTPPPAVRTARSIPPGRVVTTKEIATTLKLKATVSPERRKVMLADRTRRLELEADSRECLFNGLRFFLGEPVSLRRGALCVSRTDYEKCLVPLLNPALIPPPVPRSGVIVLDPGHGGNDTGTQNQKLGLKEKIFTLDVALRLKALLEARGYSVIMTRKTDEKVELAERALIANRAKADLFLSIHFNSLFPDTKTSGVEVFTFTRAGQRSDQSRGFGQEDDTENESMPVNRFDPWSVALAEAMHRQVITALKLPDRGHKTKHLGMLRGLNCPAALVESGFLSNEVEAAKIATSAYRQQIAAALAAGIQDYTALLESLRTKR